MLDLILFSAAICGITICVLCMTKVEPNTKWNSKIGRWGAIGMVLLIIAMSAIFYRVVGDISITKPASMNMSYSKRVFVHYSYGWCFQPTGYYNWGMCYGPKPGI